MNTYIVEIKEINWLDKESLEAEVLFELEGFLWRAFSHPCDFKKGERAEVDFSFIEEDISDITFWQENNQQEKKIVASKNDKCRYYCYGQIQSIHPVIIDCGIIKFLFGDYLNDKNIVGAYVYFVMARLDITKVKTNK